MAAEWRCIGAVMSTDVKHPVFPRVIVGKGKYALPDFALLPFSIIFATENQKTV